MPPATRLGDLTIGHCFFPVPLIEGSPNVFINNIPAGRVGDKYPPHTCGKATHQGKIAKGSNKVFINNISAARIGDPLTCGDTVGRGSYNVFIGG
jgi:hypothetical protein